MTNNISTNLFNGQKHRQMMAQQLMDPGNVPTPVAPSSGGASVLGSIMSPIMMGMSSMGGDGDYDPDATPQQIGATGMNPGMTSPDGSMQGLSPTGLSVSNPNMGPMPPSMSQAALGPNGGLTLSRRNPYRVGQNGY